MKTEKSTASSGKIETAAGTVSKEKERPPSAQVNGWFRVNLMKFKNQLKQFSGDYMKLVAKVGAEDVKSEEIPYMGCYI